MRKNFILILTAIITVLLIVEIILRVYGLGNPVIYERSLLWGYSPKANQTLKRLKGATITINEFGLRTQERFINKNKIIFYGDSVTWGELY